MSKSRQTRRGTGNKRAKRPSRPAMAPVARSRPDEEAAVAEAPVRRPATAGRPSTTSRPAASVSAAAVAGLVNFSQEYHYVLGDLKRIAILAAVMFAALVILALILT
jgi:hypothetical protein